jgi:IS5 family transposase
LGHKAYDGQREAIASADPASQNHTHGKGHRHPPLTAHPEAANRYKSSVRSKVEHPIGTIKRVFGFRRVRDGGIANNANRLFLASALADLFNVGGRLLMDGAQGVHWKHNARQRAGDSC